VRGSARASGHDLHLLDGSKVRSRVRLAQDEPTLEALSARLVTELAHDGGAVVAETPIADSLGLQDVGGHQEDLLQRLLPVVIGERA
jgi:hypothetical protein